MVDRDALERKIGGEAAGYPDLTDEFDPSDVRALFRIESVRYNVGAAGGWATSESGGRLSTGSVVNEFCEDGVCAVTTYGLHAVGEAGDNWIFPFDSMETVGYALDDYEETKSRRLRKDKTTSSYVLTLSFYVGGHLHMIESVDYSTVDDDIDGEGIIEFVTDQVLS